MYSELELSHVTETLRRLRRRIEERFPESSLGQVAEELCQVADATGPVIEKLGRPNWVVRGIVGLGVLVLFGLAGGLFALLSSMSVDVDGLGSMLQAIESAAQDVIFLGVAVFFLLTIEGRLKRRVALRDLRQLRAVVHIVDMHQLTKDPEHLLEPSRRTASSPASEFTRFELSRYLDYCSELLSLTSKLAALHAQHMNDPVVLDAVNDIEVLASNLSNKIWQKIVILDTMPRVE
jgi:hypothetical protein